MEGFETVVRCDRCGDVIKVKGQDILNNHAGACAKCGIDLCRTCAWTHNEGVYCLPCLEEVENAVQDNEKAKSSNE